MGYCSFYYQKGKYQPTCMIKEAQGECVDCVHSDLMQCDINTKHHISFRKPLADIKIIIYLMEP